LRYCFFSLLELPGCSDQPLDKNSKINCKLFFPEKFHLSKPGLLEQEEKKQT